MSRQLKTVEDYVSGIRSGDRVCLGQAITLVESTRPEHAALAQAVIARLLGPEKTPGDFQTKISGHPSLRIGITGAPGAGKSTFIEALGLLLTGRGHKVAVLAIDPTSSQTHGSILGDKTRMEQLSASEQAFIRPSPAAGSLGGVARKTRETILLVEAAGYDTVLVETVGVGQSEIAVHGMTDVFLLLLLPGAGDDLQGIKRGIVEMADVLVVNKADGERSKLANQARAHYLNALHLFPEKPTGWSPKVLVCSALEKTGIAEVWQTVEDFREKMLASGHFMANRERQAEHGFREALEAGLQTAFFADGRVRERLSALEGAVRAGQVSPFAAARTVLDAVFPGAN